MQQIFFVIILLFATGLKSQQIAFNDRLLLQLTTNHGVRMASEQAFLDSYEKQKEMYDDIKNKTAQVIAIQEYIYQQLKNVNSALSQSKKLVYFYQYMGKIATNSNKMLDLSAQHPEYAIFGVKASQKTYEQSLKIVTDVSDILASGELNLATAGDRYKLLHNISGNVKNLKLWLLAIKLRLEKANRLGFWNSINPFAGYINTDKGIVENIMNRYKRNF